MSDEIEIEEHDILDNPNIRKIFPDLSIIKKEISQYEALDVAVEDTTLKDVDSTDARVGVDVDHQDDSGIVVSQDFTVQKRKQKKHKDCEPDVHLRFKTFLDSLNDDDDDFENSNEWQSDTFNNTIPLIKKPKTEQLSKVYNEQVKLIENVKPSCNNVLILGSKPNTVNHKEPKIKLNRALNIKLENIWPYLNESKKYCKQCFILFPAKEALTTHINKTHTISTSDSSQEKNAKNKLKFTEIKFQCELCNATLCSKGNLVRHLREVHKQRKPFVESSKWIRRTKTRTVNKKILKSSSESKDKSKNSLESNRCFHCQKVFDSQTSLIEHLYDVLEPNKSASKNSEIVKKSGTVDRTGAVDIKGTFAVDNLTQSAGPETKKENNFNSYSSSSIPKIKKESYSSTTVPKSRKRSTLNGNSSKTLPKIKEESNLSSNSLIPLSDIKKEITLSSDPSIAKTDNDLQKAYKVCQELIDLKITEKLRKGLRVNENTDNETCTLNLENVNENKDSSPESNNLTQFFPPSDVLRKLVSNASESQHEVESSANTTSIQGKQVYQCYICSQYKKHWKVYSNHMDDHNIKNVHDADTVIFDGQCKFCHVKSPPDIKLYNRHIAQFHREKLFKQINADDNAFPSISFKCLKCEVCFLSAKAAKNHSEHVAIFVNWKCPECYKLYKIKDRATHLKQHLWSQDIKVYTLSASALDRVLCKCLKCAVHFSEKEYFIHYDKCPLEMPHSSYCKTCDILVNTNDMVLHELYHKDMKMSLSDFTLIESDVMNDVKRKSRDGKEKIDINSEFAFSFCSICNCFINSLHTRPKTHSSGRCAALKRRFCRKCGLTFTPRGYISHNTLHDKVKNLNLQSFYFYDHETKMQIRPPMPNYPNCTVCEVHFLTKKVLAEHLCIKQKRITCSFCKTKLTQSAYKLHVNFHKYKLSGTALHKKQIVTSVNAENAITSTTNANSSLVSSNCTVKGESSVECCEMEEAVSSTTSAIVSNVSDETNSSYLFTCIPCQVTVDTYDRVIEHCHRHYDYNISLPRLKIANDNFDEGVSKHLNFDPFYIRFDRDIWIKHIFKNVTDEQIVRILERTIYKFDCRIKMKEIQAGTSSIVSNHSTLYKCDICQCYVDPYQLYAHVGSNCTGTQTYSCSICGLCFSSEIYKNSHENCHEMSNISKTSFKIILFNEPVHRQFKQIMLASRTKYVLYQCRNCKVIADKSQREVHRCNYAKLIKCSYCRLLFYDKHLKDHLAKHELIKQFRSEHMIIIMFGKFDCKIKEGKKIKEDNLSFNGTIYDFTFYKCKTCGLCFKTITSIDKHICVSKSNELQCSICSLCFVKEDLEEHLRLHENNLEFSPDDFKTNIINYTKSNEAQSTSQKLLNEKQEGEKECLNEKVNVVDDMTQAIYKCKCGLHFLEELNAKKHLNNCNPRMKISKQSCFKCDLLFTPGELFNHLLKHHSNKKLLYKYNIISVTEGTE